ncbi:MAG: tRNA guanosine(34) transglycosylase Tgt [Candidatus Magasanikbacteria bacterium]|nr:tRNA guanosine(34) transglycosylase Tgt [Candidatus Magasanikbacteria bacterium]
MSSFFELIHEDKKTGARAGVLHTAHGDVPTPCFMPVGTQASVKALDSKDVEVLDAPIILANTYHLHLRPGEDTIARLGGLHKFMNWNRPILTDSGGFQVFSLGSNVILEAERSEADRIQSKKQRGSIAPSALQNDKGHGALVAIDDDGVTFRSHLDGSEHRFTPEIAMDIQHKLGADIIMAFDECTPDNVDHARAKEAMDRTHKWAERSLAAHNALSLRAKRSNLTQHLFGIIQGAAFEDLRKKSAGFITSLPFDGIAIGGESIGFNMDETRKTLDYLAPLLPSNKPRYTMGVGYQPQDFYDVVTRGADMFDCVSPTRMARNGTVFTSDGQFHITNAEYKEDASPIEAGCTCHTCKNDSRAYLHHLFKAQELSAYRLATIHNLHHFLSYMREMRAAILEDTLSSFRAERTK